MDYNKDDVTTKKNECLEKITEIFDYNMNDNFIIDKVHNYVSNLDVFVRNIKKQIEERAIRKEELTKQKEIFTKNFLSHNQFYFLASNSKYFYYDGINYYNENEDEIHFKCLTGITNHENLNDWKQKTKLSVLKEIKNKSILKTIPETITIQNVINKFTPIFFKSKTETKYFLTIIGDSILKKGNDLTFFINPKSKFFLKELQNNSYSSFGNYNITDNFKIKYRDQSFYNIRLVSINNNIENSDLWKGFLKNNILDLLCVSIHYSNRYKSSEEFLFEHCKEIVKKQILFLKTHEPDILVEKFIDEYLILDKSIKLEISWKNMHFLWKKFVESIQIPNVIYINSLKLKLLHLINKKLGIETKDDSFRFITSIHLPNIDEFITFWNENMEHEVKENIVGEFEVSEVILLYNDYRISKGLGISDIEEDFVTQIIYHFMDNIEVEKDKFILNVYSKLWNKEQDVFMHIQEYLTKTENPTIYEAYEYYTENSQGKKFIVSKRFFEKCFTNYFSYN